MRGKRGKEVLSTYSELDQVPHRKLERERKGSKRRKRKNMEDTCYFKKCKQGLPWWCSG